MNDFLMQLAHASFQGGVIIAVILALRLVLRKAPKSILCLLWLLAITRLLLPIQLESRLSLQPDIAVITQQESQQPGITVDMPKLPANVAPSTSTTIKTDDGQLLHVELTYSNEAAVPEQSVTIDWAGLLPWLWLAVAAGLALWSILSYWKLRGKTQSAVILRDRVWLSPELDSAFVLGYLKPQIYLPAKLEAEERQLVISHEQAHIRRFDHWYKLLGFAAVCIHWFNPLVWAAYIFLCRDMEMACDEQVVRDMDTQQRKAYSMALLRCSADNHHFKPCPVAFAEVSVKDRIKGVLHYKKPGFWMTLVGIVAVVFVAVCFLTSPEEADEATKMTRLCRDAVEEIQNANSYYLTEEQYVTRIYGEDFLGLAYDTAESLRSGSNWLRVTVSPDFTNCYLQKDGQQYIKYISDAVAPGELGYADWTAVDLSQIQTFHLSWLEELDWDQHEIVYVDQVINPAGLLDVSFTVDLDESDPDLTMTTLSFQFDPDTMTLLSVSKCITSQSGGKDSKVTIEAVNDPTIDRIIDTYYHGVSQLSPDELRQHCIDLMKQLRAKEYRYLSFTVEFSDPEHNDEYIRQIEMPGFYFLEELLYEDGAQKPHYQLARIAAQDGAECYERLILNPGDTWVQKANHEMKWSRFIPEYLNDDPTDFKHYPMEICEFEDSIWCVFDATDDVEIKKNIEFHFDINGKLASIVIRDFSSYGESVRTYDDLWKTESDIQQLADELLAEARKHAAYQQQADDLEQELDEIQDQYASQQIDQIMDTYYHGVSQLSPDALRQKCIDIQEILYGTVASLETDSPIHLLVTVNKGEQNEYQSELIHYLPLEYIRNTFTNADYTQEYFYVKGNSDNPYEYYKRTYNTSMRQETDTGWIAKETGPIFPFFILWVTPDELENSSFSTSSDANGLSCIFETTDEKNTVYTYTYHFDRSGSLVSITQNCMYLDGETLTNTAVIVSTSADEINAKLDTLLTEARKHAAYQQQADDLEQELDEIQDQYASQQTQP